MTCPDGLECAAGMCRLEGVSGPCRTNPGDGGGSGDALIDTPMAQWSEPEEVLLAGGPWSSPTLNGALTEIFIEGPGGEIYRATRTGATWTDPVPAQGLEAPTSKRNTSPMLSRSGIMMFLGSDRGDASGAFDVWRIPRPDATSPFLAPQASPLVVLNDATHNDNGGSMTADEKLILFTSDRDGTASIYQSTYNEATGAFLPPTLVSQLDSSDDDSHASISANGLVVVFASNRLGADYDLYIATRPDVMAPFSTPMRIPEMSMPATPEVDPWLSADGNTIFFGRGIAQTRKIFRSTRL